MLCPFILVFVALNPALPFKSQCLILRFGMDYDHDDDMLLTMLCNHSDSRRSFMLKSIALGAPLRRNCMQQAPGF